MEITVVILLISVFGLILFNLCGFLELLKIRKIMLLSSKTKFLGLLE